MSTKHAEKPKLQKSVGYAYPSSTNAQRMGFAAKGCYCIETGYPGKPMTAQKGFATFEAAVTEAAMMKEPWSEIFLTANPLYTPLGMEWAALKGKVGADVILCIRLGDFYELFFDDAKAAAPILNVALTRRREIPMAGFPVHAARTYLNALLIAGRKVAIAERMEAGQAMEPREWTGDFVS